jgi:peptidoglycan/LPS O-acetylase OafA/YrhL
VSAYRAFQSVGLPCQIRRGSKAGTSDYAPPMSRLAAVASVLFAAIAVAYVWGVTASPDSDLKVGVIGALPFFGFAAACGLWAYWTRRPPGSE